MSPSISNSSSPRRSPSTRRASPRSRARSSSSTTSISSLPYEPAEYLFTSPTPIEINRTVSVTVEVSSSSTPASHMDVSQYHMPVTTSCYSPTSSGSYPDMAWGFGTFNSNSSQGTYPWLSPATSSYYWQSPENETQSSTEHSYKSAEDRSGNGIQSDAEHSYKFAEEESAEGSQYQQQHGPDSTHTFSNIKSSQINMLDRFLVVDSREDALVVEARAAIKEGRVSDNNTFAPNIYGWETAIESLLKV